MSYTLIMIFLSYNYIQYEYLKPLLVDVYKFVFQLMIIFNQKNVCTVYMVCSKLGLYL